MGSGGTFFLFLSFHSPSGKTASLSEDRQGTQNSGKRERREKSGMVMGSLRKRLALGFMCICALLVMCMTGKAVFDKYQFGTEILKPQKTRAGPVKMAKAPDLSYIGDTYASDDEVSQTVSFETFPMVTDSTPLPIPHQPFLQHCPTGIRARVSVTKYNSTFLKNIPVLQWLKHASKIEHERLRKYPGAHGLELEVGKGGLVGHSYRRTQVQRNLVETLSALNTTANQFMFDDWDSRANGSTCISCAVVGNGGILRGSKKGREIDQHHYVFRVNGAVIKGFEEDIGSRTTHYTFSTNTLGNSMRSYAKAGFHGPPKSKETRYIFLPDQGRDYTLLKSVTSQTKTFLRSNILKGRFRDWYRPTTGAVMLMAAMHTCDQVDAYGFITPDYKKYSDHYYDKSFHRVIFYVNHDMRLELKVWQELHKARLINLYMRK
ncbi:hypothetical protein JZ751_027549 [Albula glossodonta]|uniref:alpha-N-acetylgalactosaminide alpha-2,6-sialyltransferase n=1 Tax=Albula glossodonta TaxID=121402 RepID=A0A8T2NDJ4_9TELE|nr:hypothetical protein JZ751_027549 [Albula glossodonta]